MPCAGTVAKMAGNGLDTNYSTDECASHCLEDNKDSIITTTFPLLDS